MNMRSPGPYKFTTFEKVRANRPKNHISFIRDACKDKSVLDIGCLDETAHHLKSEESLLHFQIGQVARSLIGIDNSPELKNKSLITAYSTIYPIDIYSEEFLSLPTLDFDVVVISMVIEHLANPIDAITRIKKTFPNSELILTTTNATGITNVIAAGGWREIQHKDHVATFSYKTLDNIITMSGYTKFVVYSLSVSYPEAKARLRNSKLPWIVRRIGSVALSLLEKLLNSIEYLFPLYASGLIAYCYPDSKHTTSSHL
jgi:SAM-dependent methyltransferase